MSDVKLVNASVTFPPDLLRQIDAQAHSRDLNRSQYLRMLARNDIERWKAENPDPQQPVLLEVRGK